MSKVKLVLVGIGGYGSGYVRSLLNRADSESFIINGAVDPYPEASSEWNALRKAGIPIFSDLEQFYAVSDADLAVISSPIHYHCLQTKYALAQGSHVLCEKPICVTREEAADMIRARDEAGRFVAIGYQWSFSPTILDMKKDIGDGILGKPIRLKTLVLWPRSDGYYARSWAGRMRDGNGNLVMDSIANNATAHYIHNMFFVLGSAQDSSVSPASVQAELYRAYRIETFDTAAIRCMTECGTEILYYASHAVKDSVGPELVYEFEKGVITYHSEQGFVAAFHNGEIKRYGNPAEEDNFHKLWKAIDAVREEAALPCGLETSLPHMMCVHGMHASMADIVEFSPGQIRRTMFPDGQQGNSVDGLAEALRACFESNTLPSEAGMPWAKAGRVVKVCSASH